MRSYRMGTLSRSNWNLEMLVLEEWSGVPAGEKHLGVKDENQQQTQPTAF